MFKAEAVTAVYSGRQGCACGCRGKYTYASAHVGEAIRRGHRVRDDEVNDRAVQMMVKKVERIIREQPERIDAVYVDDGYVWVDMKDADRCYAVRFD